MKKWIPMLFLFISPLWAEKPILVINEDNDHYFKQAPEFMTEEALRAYIDQFANTHVTHFFMCPQGQRASYDSKVTEPIWEGVTGGEIDYGPGQDGIRWTSNCKTLCEKGIDPYKIWIERCRQISISPWMTMRMNDAHFLQNRNYFRTLNFWREHPELWLDPNQNSAFNYAKKEVRDYHLAIVRELFERYDFDGLELDWVRMYPLLTPGKEREESIYLTEFMREVRKISKEWEEKRGHSIALSARVVAEPKAAEIIGMNPVQWAQEGLIDVLVISNFWSTSDFELSANEWKKAMGDVAKNVKVLVATDAGINSGAAPMRGLTLEMYNAWAANGYHQGADGVYLFNLVYNPTLLRKVIQQGLAPETVQNAPRRHPVTYHDYLLHMLPHAKDWDEGKQLPRKTDVPQEFRVQFGKVPDDGDLFVLLSLRSSDSVQEGEYEILLNGRKPTSMTEESDRNNYGSAGRTFRCAFPMSTAKDGHNIVRVIQKSGSPQVVVWVEMQVR
ncbi:MAG: hypothetical protein Q4E67_04615 [Planctomycetia bacterium]|nr:hypothetical protein [Planctomycetia bacterium]